MGRRWSELSKTRETSHSVAAFLDDPPLKNRWVSRSARSALELVGPRTKRMASEMFDLPIPFGPATPVKPGSKGISVEPANDLKFRTFTRLRYIVPPSAPFSPTRRRLRSVCQTDVSGSLSLPAVFNY